MQAATSIYCCFMWKCAGILVRASRHNRPLGGPCSSRASAGGQGGSQSMSNGYHCYQSLHLFCHKQAWYRPQNKSDLPCPRGYTWSSYCLKDLLSLAENAENSPEGRKYVPAQIWSSLITSYTWTWLVSVIYSFCKGCKNSSREGKKCKPTFLQKLQICCFLTL